jgi:hypothetical protein
MKDLAAGDHSVLVPKRRWSVAPVIRWIHFLIPDYKMERRLLVLRWPLVAGHSPRSVRRSIPSPEFLRVFSSLYV